MYASSSTKAQASITLAVLRPVPTAVPPRARRYSDGNVASTRPMPYSTLRAKFKVMKVCAVCNQSVMIHGKGPGEV